MLAEYTVNHIQLNPVKIKRVAGSKHLIRKVLIVIILVKAKQKKI